MGSRWLLPLLFSLTTSTLLAQSPPSATPTEPTVQNLLDRIPQLEKRIAQLEDRERKQQAAQAGTPPVPVLAPAETTQAAVTTPTAAPAPAASHEDHASIGEMRDRERRCPSLQIRGFGDVDFSATDQKGSVSGFNLGQLVLHLASPLSEKVSYFGEVSFTAQPTGYELSVERSIIRYDYNDYFKLSFGKYHTPIGYWNTAFHHGAWLQTTIARPEMVKVGGTFTPVHFVGLLAEGNIPSGGLGLSYNLGVGNGRGDVISRPGDAGDINNNRAWVAKVYARPPKLYGLELGASIYQDKIAFPSLTNQKYRGWIVSASLGWTKRS